MDLFVKEVIAVGKGSNQTVKKEWKKFESKTDLHHWDMAQDQSVKAFNDAGFNKNEQRRSRTIYRFVDLIKLKISELDDMSVDMVNGIFSTINNLKEG